MIFTFLNENFIVTVKSKANYFETTFGTGFHGNAFIWLWLLEMIEYIPLNILIVISISPLLVVHALFQLHLPVFSRQRYWTQLLQSAHIEYVASQYLKKGVELKRKIAFARVIVPACNRLNKVVLSTSMSCNGTGWRVFSFKVI